MKPLLLFLLSLTVWAHPVIYKDGWVYWGTFSDQSSTQRVSYTFHPKFTFEVNSEFYQALRDYRDTKLGFNALIKRWLFDDSQGNIYGAIHWGNYSQKDSDGRVLHPLIMADWESRKYYTALSFSSLHLEEQNLDKISYRLGIAPYIVGMEEMQTWMIFQFDYFKEMSRTIKVTPLMRFFYHNALWEMGSDLEGDIFLTLMIHY